jgi:hypothetical protein
MNQVEEKGKQLPNADKQKICKLAKKAKQKLLTMKINA